MLARYLRRDFSESTVIRRKQETMHAFHNRNADDAILVQAVGLTQIGGAFLIFLNLLSWSSSLCHF